eukprot:19187-Heterococcus_DN1.PRE.1
MITVQHQPAELNQAATQQQQLSAQRLQCQDTHPQQQQCRLRCGCPLGLLALPPLHQERCALRCAAVLAASLLAAVTAVL